jgi:AraC-like DNA-binding protein
MYVDLIPTIISSATVGACILALASSIQLRPQVKPRDNYLSAVFALLLLNALGELFIASGTFRFAPHLAGAELPIRMLLGPAMYLYARNMMSIKPTRPWRTLALASLGPICIILIMLPFSALSAEQKLSLADASTRDPELFKFAVVTCLAAGFLFIAFTAAYTFAALKIQAKHRERMMLAYANIESRSVDWLKIILLVWLAVWVLYAIDKISWALDLSTPGLSTILSLAQAITMVIFARLALGQATPSATAKSDMAVQAPGRPKVAGLSVERMQRIAEKLEREMKDNRLYTDHDLSLRRLSDITHTSENHLSETFSQYLNTNFFQFVNGYRVQEAKQLLIDTELSVTTIAVNVGYSSRSTFNNAFKRDTGLSPTAFRKQHQSQQ